MKKIEKALLAAGYVETGSGGDRQHAPGPGFTSYRKIPYSLDVYDKFFSICKGATKGHDGSVLVGCGETIEDLQTFFNGDYES